MVVRFDHVWVINRFVPKKIRDFVRSLSLLDPRTLKGRLCQANPSRALVHRHRNVWAFHCQGIIVNLIWSPSLITS
jgi:hypothetical protein